MKHPQYIVAFHKKQFGEVGDGITPMGIADLKERAERSLFIGRRHELEINEEFGQALPYVVVMNDTGIFTYRRTAKVGEQRLAGNYSIGIGGHIDANDVKFSDASIIHPLATIAAAITRELNEELVLTKDGVDLSLEDLAPAVQQGMYPHMLGIINDTSNEVGRVHYGILMSIRIPDGFTVRCREEELETVGLIQKPESTEGYENWSKLVLDFLFKDGVH
jgi:predicted NUDIX family phosphoesterase